MTHAWEPSILHPVCLSRLFQISIVMSFANPVDVVGTAVTMRLIYLFEVLSRFRTMLAKARPAARNQPF